MSQGTVASARFVEGYVITRTPEGLEIRTTEYHAWPLRLDRDALARFGLSLAADRPSRRGGDPGAAHDVSRTSGT